MHVREEQSGEALYLAVYSAAREQPHTISVCGERQLSLEQIILAETFLLSKSGQRGLFGFHILGHSEVVLPIPCQ